MGWFSIIGNVLGIGKTYLETKGKIKQAKLDAELQIQLESQENLAVWEQLHAKGSDASWKDEFWTIVWSIPLILAFVEFPFFNGPQVAFDGFAALKEMPEWYQYTLISMVLASFGIRVGSTIKGQLDKFKNA